MKDKIYLTILLIVVALFAGYVYVKVFETKDATTNVGNMQASKRALNLYIKILKNKTFAKLVDKNPDTGCVYVMSDIFNNNDDILVILSGVRDKTTLTALIDYIKTYSKQKNINNKIYLLLYAKPLKQDDGNMLLPDESYFISKKRIY